MIQEYTRMTRGSEPSKPSANGRSTAKPLKAALPKSYSTTGDTTITREEDILPLQNFEGVGTSDNVEREVKQNYSQERKLSEGTDFKPGLHIHGDMSTNRPGHFKRWDSEARIGGGHGVEEVEDRI